MVRLPPSRLIDVCVVVACAALLAFPGLGLRDLAGEEVSFYGERGFIGILREALDPASHGSVTGRQPLSYLVRWVVLAVAGEWTPFALRLHAAVFACLAAGATWFVLAEQRGRALLAGLMVGASPLLVFHAHESSGYAASALFGALLLGGLARVRQGRSGMLAAAVVLGIANDFFFGFAVLGALLVTPWGVGAARRAWAIAGGILLLPALSYSWSLTRIAGGRRMGPHLDPAPEGASLVGEWFDAARKLAEGVTHGYTRDPQAADLVPLLVLGSAAVLGWVGGRREAEGVGREAARLLPVALAVGGLASFVVQAATGGAFTTHPRAFLGLLPAAAVLVAGFPGRFGLVLPACALLLGTQALGSLRVALDPPQAQRRVAAVLAEEARAGDLVWTTEIYRPRLGGLDPGVSVATSTRGCVPALPGGRVWVVRGEAGAPLPLCDGEVDPAALGRRAARIEVHALPEHEAWTPAYLPATTALTLWDGSEPAEPEAFVREVVVHGRAAYGAEAVLVLRVRRPDGVVRFREAPVPTADAPWRVELPFPAGSSVRPVLHPDGRDRPGLELPARVLAAGVPEESWALQPPLRIPSGLETALRRGLAGAPLLLLLALLPRRRRP